MKQMAKHNEIGVIGEEIASEWLNSKGFLIIEQNYRKKWGEIDIVARGTDQAVHFVEVKTVSFETKNELERSVSYGTYKPEDNVHIHKQQRLGRAIQTWLSEHDYSGDWQIDIVAIRVVPREKYCRIKFLDNVIFDN